MLSPELAMKCAQCGHENLPEAQVCSKCGSWMEPSAVAPSEQPVGRLRARDVGGLVSETFGVYGRNFWPFVLIAFLAQIPALVATVTPGLVSVMLNLLSVFLGILASGAIVHAVAQQYLGREIDIGECFGRAWGRAGALIIAFILVGLALLGSAILMVVIIGIPLFFYLLVSLFFYIQPIMLEGKGPIAALGRSRELVRGSWWRVFVIGIIFVVIGAALGIAAAIPGVILTIFSPTIGSIFFTAVQVVLLPIAYIGATLVYLDLRVRKEGYTLEVLALEVGR